RVAEGTLHRPFDRSALLSHEPGILGDELHILALPTEYHWRLSAHLRAIEAAFAQTGLTRERKHEHFVQLIGLNFEKDFVLGLIQCEQPFYGFGILDDVCERFLWRRFRLFLRCLSFFLRFRFLWRLRAGDGCC